MSSYKPAHLFSDGPRRCIRRTTRGCRPYRSFLLECRFGRSGSSGFVGGFRRLRWSGCVPVLKDRRNPGRYRYRYICRPGGFLAANGCRPKRIQFSLRGCLKLLRLSDDLAYPFAQGIVGVRQSFFRTVFLEDFGFNQFVEARLNLQLAYY